MIRLVGSAWPSGCHTESLLDDKSHLISSTRVPDLAVAQAMNRASKTRVILAAPFRRRAPAALAIRASSGAAIGSSRRHYLVRRKRRLRLQTNCRCSIRWADCLAMWCLLGEDTRRVGHVVEAKCRPIVSRTMAPLCVAQVAVNALSAWNSRCRNQCSDDPAPSKFLWADRAAPGIVVVHPPFTLSRPCRSSAAGAVHSS